MSKQLDYYLWVEKYRPSCLKEVILPSSLRKLITNWVEVDKQIPNLILYAARPGNGKTTISKVIVNELNADSIYINASKDTGIDVLRSTIQKFAVSKSFDGRPKIVILDELGNSGVSTLQDGLRAFIEEFHKSCRFIITTNYISKIIEPLKSRCQTLDFNFSDTDTIKELTPKIAKRLVSILDNEGIGYDGSTVLKLVDIHFPDFRRMISLCQQYSKTSFNVETGKSFIDANIFKAYEVDDSFYKSLLDGKLVDCRKYLIDRSVVYDEMFRKLYDDFIPLLSNDKKSQIILLINEYMFKHQFVIDKEINFAALMIEIVSVIKGG